MKIPDMNEKNTRAFLDKVRERASSYTPEWRMDLENPDGGTALALLFAGMYEDTLKNMLSFREKVCWISLTVWVQLWHLRGRPEDTRYLDL